jgi:hypothetical protein
MVGPSVDLGQPDEALETHPSRWYLTGFLAPLGADLTQRSDEEAPEDMEEVSDRRGLDDDSVTDRTAAKARPFPSSMGLSFLVGPDANDLKVKVRWGDYEPVQERGYYWQRIPRETVLTLKVPTANTESPQETSIPETKGLVLSLSTRRIRTEFLPEGHSYAEGTRSVSLFVVNRRSPEKLDSLKDKAFAFQVELAVEAEEGFVPRIDLAGLRSQEVDDCIADLQYRDEFEFAVGHGVSAEAFETGNWCSSIRTTWVPVAAVERVEPSSLDGKAELSMEALAELSDFTTAKQLLGGLVTHYKSWIAAQVKTAPTSPKSRADTSALLIQRATQAADRIERGIEALADPQVLDAFRTANKVLALYARRRSTLGFETKPNTAQLPSLTKEPIWRPFQLAFILLNLAGVANPIPKAGEPNDREIVDLLFFPTGGGKTEAYLGLAAFTLLLRRLRHEGLAGAGVSVIMRYTLRLLTLDQLSRASSVICAMELERQANPGKWGTWPFEIGLWVGSGATPNILGGKGNKKEHTALFKLEQFKARSGKAQSPIPLEVCPWCGTQFKPSSFNMYPNQENPIDLRISCSSSACEFSGNNRLPVIAVDEPIYRRLPCFLIATVDKFAAMPWTGEVSKFFGRVQNAVGDGKRIDDGFYSQTDVQDGKVLPGAPLPSGHLLPPDLVIQDELHLISGPLGTMVGLYETALEEVCCQTVDGKVIRPKIVASTATVRRSQAQIQALFARTAVQVFPPQGPDRRDSFFAETVKAEVSPARFYVGIAAQGRNPKSILLRTYLTLLGAGEKAYLTCESQNLSPNPADPYMTLVGYFNSLRELGGARRIIEDEVTSRLRKYGDRRRYGEKRGYGLFANRDISFDVLELTSRENTSKVAEAKKRLDEMFFRSSKKSESKGVDVAIATNMISVGLDIPRLGMMVVFGQPKTTSEYIQASSRVGREKDKPGLVITILNLNRPRDRSHYERFEYYHRTFYRRVEASSVTPFSPRALDRGLAGTVVALARMAEPEMTPPHGAAQIISKRARLNWIVDIVRQRVEKHANKVLPSDGTEPQADTVAARVSGLLDAWEGIALDLRTTGTKLQYQVERPGQGQRLLYEFLNPEVKPKSLRIKKFRANRSLRDVEPNVKLWMWKEEDTEEPE